MDTQDVQRRRIVAAVVALLVFVLFAVGLNSCLDSRSERALKDYNRDVTAIVESSDDQVSKQLFEVLSSGGPPNDLQVQVNQVRLVAEEDVKRAQGLAVPGAMAPAHRHLLLALNLRASGVGKIADALTDVGANAAASEQAAARVSGQMQAFLASDVVWAQRVAPLIDETLVDADIGGQTIPDSQFLPSLGWLDVGNVAERIGVTQTSSSTKRRAGEPAPGLHGHGLLGVTAAGTALQPGEVVNRIAASAGLAFDVSFANQGDNDETDVKVTIKIEGAGKPITAAKTVNQTLAKKTVPVSIPLTRTPPVGQPVTITISVAGVPGEKKLDNNKQTYTALFTR